MYTIISPKFLFKCSIIAIILWLIFGIVCIVPWRGGVTPTFKWHHNFDRNISLYIKPGIETVILQPRVRCTSSTYLVIVVPSAVNNTDEREAIRSTWGSWVRKGEITINDVLYKANTHMKLIFMLGRLNTWPNGVVTSEIVDEHAKYNDIVLEDFLDTYLNLTLKSIFFLKWVSESCPSAKFVMKADDDMFVNVPNLLKSLAIQKPQTRLMMGTLICNARPINDRWSKWFSPSYMFSGGKYPNYLSGTSYVISTDLINPLLKTALNIQYFHLEDVFLTGICAKRLGIKLKDNVGFSYLKRPLNPCVYNLIIAGHDVNTKEMVRIWNLMHNMSSVSKCKPIKKTALRSYSPGKCVWK